MTKTYTETRIELGQDVKELFLRVRAASEWGHLNAEPKKEGDV